MPKLSTEEAVVLLRGDPKHATLMSESYLDEDVHAAAKRFQESAEFVTVVDLFDPLSGKVILDLGAGNGIASYAFARHGASVYALEPSPSEMIGRRAIEKITAGLSVEVIDGVGESIPLGDASVDHVYARQVLHHAENLEALMGEVARVLRPGGTLLACREHVVDNARQLARFRRGHIVHRLAGGESAHPLSRYVNAITAAGLQMEQILGPWDSVINAYPIAKSVDELQNLPRTILAGRLGAAGEFLSRLPLVSRLVWKAIRLPRPGRLYAFMARRR